MEVIINRFEGEYAVVEVDFNTIVNIPRILIPDAKEGDVISIYVNKDKTLEREKYIKDLMDDIFLD